MRRDLSFAVKNLALGANSRPMDRHRLPRALPEKVQSGRALLILSAPNFCAGTTPEG